LGSKIEDARLPVGREDRNAQLWIVRQFLLLALSGKAADNQIFQCAYPQIHQNSTLIDLDSRFSIDSC
jgi:hypothetical protein